MQAELQDAHLDNELGRRASRLHGAMFRLSETLSINHSCRHFRINFPLEV